MTKDDICCTYFTRVFPALGLIYLATSDFLLFICITLTGELSLLRSPSCSSSESVYICSGSSTVEWDIANTEPGIRPRFGRDTTPAGHVVNFTAGTSHISFLVSNNTDNFISVTATITNAISLNGTMMTCNGEKFAIMVALPGALVQV